MTAPLHGHRVLDLTDERGWLAGKLLADLGAEVIKVEPRGGDPGRAHGPFFRGIRDGEHSLRWWFENRGKQSIVCDVATDPGRERLLGLVEGADALLESYDVGWLSGVGLGTDVLLARNPQLVHTSITPFGGDGPAAEWRGPDLVIAATSGIAWLTGDTDRPPVRISVPQMYLHASAEAAAHTVIALHYAARTGVGQHIDVSAQASGVRLLMNAQAYPLLEGRDLVRAGASIGSRDVGFRLVYPCADGFVAMLVVAGPLGAHIMKGITNWAVEEAGVGDAGVPEYLVDLNWAEVDFSKILTGGLPEGFLGDVNGMLGGLFAKHNKAEIYDHAMRSGALIAPVNTVVDCRVDEQLAAREYFAPVDHDDAGTIAYPTEWIRMGASPLARTPRAPRVGEHDATVSARPRPAPAGEPPGRLPFEGLKVWDMSWVGVGPITATYLALYGATVIRLDWSRRPDVLRVSPPFVGGRPGLNRSHFYADFNPNKLGIGLDITKPEGQNVARKLAVWADVVTESFTPGTLADYGLDYEQLRQVNPGLIMYSTCMQGQTGPRASYRGFGQLMAAMAGFYQVTGWPDRDPVMVFGAYTDFINPRLGTAALVAALEHRRRTGEGQHLDLSQFEGALQFQGPELLDYEVNRTVATRRGNSDDRACPHGVFRCVDEGRERWVAIVCETDEQWAALVRAMGEPRWATDPAYATFAGRKEAEDEIESGITAWTSPRHAEEVVRLLQPRVAAGVVHDQTSLHRDAQLVHRDFFVPLEHTVMGSVPYHGSAATMSVTPPRLHKAAPCIGEDSFTILTDILGLSEDEVGDLLAVEAIEIVVE